MDGKWPGRGRARRADIDSYKSSRHTGATSCSHFRRWIPLIIDALRLRRDYIRDGSPTGAIGAGDYARTLQQSGGARWCAARAAQKRSLPCTIALVVGQACSFTTSRFGDEVPYVANYALRALMEGASDNRSLKSDAVRLGYGFRFYRRYL